jgi:hypothetical protein
MDWTRKEVSLIVEDYFKMLQLELGHDNYNKTSHRLKLISLLDNRSEGSIEFKHQNISAALIQMGLPFIKGYKPRFNYQKLLETEIAKFIKEHQIKIEKTFTRFSEEVIEQEKNEKIDFENILDQEEINSEFKEREITYQPIKINYLEREQNNRKLGEKGEGLIIQYEKWRLTREGKENLADKIEWVSKELGDGMGYDILSKNINGSDRYIEVKTTKLSKETPIYLTSKEVSFASLKQKDFYLYRIFNWEESPRFFVRNGKYENFCNLQPNTYKGFFES